ncbi:NADH-quinone oxidoreductase [Mobiluncus curtisii]|uniref:NAD(P)H quinone oxidoreductase, PIG3 family n=2 Tax=Mobiluncus curtisii TaxID=2051 RepID=E6M086_9ACTO|nr:NADH-quinone oxidoreductase [Mobiluncus curtisii]EFU79366.1 NAD(P)H quinone oxidoreductase, PIG3 family [Mobiluncus curtisii ATCC 51333]
MWSVQGVDGVPAVVEVERPPVGAGEILLEVVAAGVNRADLLQVAGHYPPPAGAPQTLGLEAAGTVVEVGPGVDPVWLGRAAVALVEGGAQAQFCVAHADLALPLPVSGRLNGYVAGAALLEAAVTAWHNLVDCGFPADSGAGRAMLIHGGSGAVGTVAVQLAKALGATVGTTAGEPDRCHKLILLGADAAADYHDPDGLLRMKQELTAGRGFDLILDVAGAGGLETNLELLAPSGILNIIGLQKGRHAQLDLGQVLSKSARIQGSTIRGLDVASKVRLVRAVGTHVWPLVQAQRIRPVIAHTLAFSKAKRAHKYLAKATARPLGKIVLFTEA